MNCHPLRRSFAVAVDGLARWAGGWQAWEARMKNLEPRSECDLVTVPARQGLEAVDILRRGLSTRWGPS